MSSPRYIKPLSQAVTDDERLWLVKLMEECAELQQAAAKILRHGFTKLNTDAPQLGTNEEQLEREVDDVDEAIGRLYRLRPGMTARRAAKQAKP